MYKVDTTNVNKEAKIIIKYESQDMYQGEKEPNNTYDTANVIQPNTTYEGNCTPRQDVDIYKFYMEQPGLAVIDIKNLRGDNSTTSPIIYEEDEHENVYLITGATNKRRLRLPAGAYYIEMTTHVAGEDYEFNFTQFFDDDYIFIFDVIVSLFEHCPHIVGELCSLILAQYNSSYELIKYTSSFDFDLMSDDYKLMFNDDVINNCKYTYDDIVCLERFNSKYYGVINNKRFIFEEVIGSDSLNIYSENSSPIGEEVFILMKAIRDGIIKKFNRLEVSLEKNFSKCLVLYSYDVSVYDKKFLVFNKLLDKEVTFSLMENKCLKVIFCSDEFKNKIIKYIEDKYEKDKAKELVDFIF